MNKNVQVLRRSKWSGHSLAPEVRLDSVEAAWGFTFQEVRYGAAGSWDICGTELHIASLATTALHRIGPENRSFRQMVPSTGIALPNQRIVGGWLGEMTGRHLFLGPEQYELLMDEPFRPESFQTRSFACQSDPTRTDTVADHILAALAADLRAGSPAGPAFAQMAACALFSHERTNQPRAMVRATVRANRDRRILQVIDDIHARLESKITLTRLARNAGISVQYLCRRFRQSTGLTPHQYILQQRARKAQELIRRSDQSLAQIAVAVGFSDQSQMSTTVRRVIGLSPSMIRRSR